MAMTILKNYWNNLQLEAIINRLFSKFVSLTLLILAFVILKWILDLFFTKAIEQSSLFNKQSHVRQKTLIKLLKNVVNYGLYFFLFYWILSILGVPISSLLAGAGLAGVAIGLGAQGFLSDVVNGFFILMENQFDVGEVVTIDTVEGTVINVGIRTTQIEGFDGIIHFIPNRHITIVSNQSRHHRQAQVSIPLPLDTDLQRVATIIQKVNQKTLKNYPAIIGEATLLGALPDKQNQLLYKVNFEVENGQQVTIATEFFQSYQEALLAEGIHLAKPAFCSEND